jgi:serine/threonine protein kinase/tetratricopeptide (TPR) repeat protein
MAMSAPSVGQVFGHYRLIEQIGAGGMGVVFRAHDEQLQRDVAVKILSQDSVGDAIQRERLRKEALAVARLNHPNIAMAFDFGCQDGIDYLVSEYIPGLNLDEKIGKQPLPQKTVLELGIQLLSGLEAAHRENVIHRDLKPGNIRLHRDGQLKILDFGLAKLNQPLDESSETATITVTTSVSGTLPYMAPELLRGEPSDARADIWAAGAVLYEMATGKRAFPDRQPSMAIDAILHYDPVRPTLINPTITMPLEAVILKALDRDPDRRYQSAREMRIDLQRLLSGGEIATDTLKQSRVMEIAGRRRKQKIAIGVVAILLAGVAIGLLAKRLLPAISGKEKIMAVLPIETVGQDASTSALGLGLTETLTAKLVQASNGDSVQVVSPRDLRDQSVKTAVDARREFGTDYVLESSLQRSGNMLRVNCYLVDSRTHRQLSARTVESDDSDTFKLQDQVVNAVLDMLPQTVKASERQALATRQDTQPAVYDAYIRGRGYLLEYEKPENIDNAIAEFNQALKVDPRYAPAYAALGQAYWLGFQQNRGEDWLSLAGQNCRQSVNLAPQLAEAHTCMGNVAFGTGKYEEAVMEYQRSLDLDPNGDYALGQLADAYQELGKSAAAEAAYKKAISVRPKYWAVYNWLGVFYINQSRYNEAAEMFNKVIELAPDNYRGYSNLGGAYVYEGRYGDAIEILKKSIALRPSVDACSNLGTAYFSLRRFSDAADNFQQATKINDRNMTAWGNLGDALYWTPSRRAESKAAYDKALELGKAQEALNPRDGETLAMMADYYAMTGQKAEAMDSLQKAVRLEPKNSEVLFRAALVYNHFGQTTEALQWLQKAIEAGYSRSEVRDFPDFDSLQSNPQFRALLANN